MKRAMLAWAGIAMVTGVPLAYGHHSFAADYFEDQMVSIQGAIEEFDYRNPHAIVRVRVDENGTPVVYAAEWAGAGRLSRQGITAETLKPGDQVIVSGSPGRDPSAKKLHLKGIERPADGWQWQGRNRRSR